MCGAGLSTTETCKGTQTRQATQASSIQAGRGTDRLQNVTRGSALGAEAGYPAEEAF